MRDIREEKEEYINIYKIAYYLGYRVLKNTKEYKILYRVLNNDFNINKITKLVSIKDKFFNQYLYSSDFIKNNLNCILEKYKTRLIS